MSDDDNDNICPLCCEELDLSDQSFYPCKCGYQVCMWCWHRIKEQETGLCPACRTPYGDDPHEFSAVDMEEVIQANKEKRRAEKRERERLRAMREQEKREQLADYAVSASSVVGGGTANFAGALVGGGGLGGTSSFGQFDGADLVAALGSAASHSAASHNRGPPEPPKDRSTLATMRVIRRNLVYAVGLPPNIATEELLRKPEYFGQYGKISKIVINRNHNPGADPRRASASAYVTFAHKEDTLACVLALDGFYHDGRNIRASYGTSKYCSAFIKSVRCNNPDCTYLHHMGDAEDTFTKQEIQAGYVTSGRDVLTRQQQIMAQQAAAAGVGGKKKVGGGGPSGTGKASSSPVFPPPTFDEPLPKKTRAMSHNRVNSAHNAMHGGGAGLSAASIVAGIGVTAPAAPPPPHTTLTPLKRAGSMPLSAKPAGVAEGMAKSGSQPLVGNALDLTPAESLALQEQRKEAALAAQQQQQREMAMKQRKHPSSTPSSPSHSSVGSSGSKKMQNGHPGGIGGSNLHMGAPLIATSGFPGNFGGGGGSIGAHTGSGILGGQPLSLSSNENRVIGGASLAPTGFSGFGSLAESNKGSDNWGATGGPGGSQNVFGGSGALWGGNDLASKPAPIGPSNRSAPGSDVGGMSLFGANNNTNTFGNGDSALANMLGIELPTGSGSLRESSTPLSGFSGGSTVQPSVGAVGGGVSSNGHAGTVKQPIGAPASTSSGGIPISGFSGGNNDMALLQSLLPGVNITSGNAYRPAAPQYHSEQQQSVGAASLGQGSDQWNQGGQQQQDEQRSSIW